MFAIHQHEKKKENIKTDTTEEGKGGEPGGYVGTHGITFFTAVYLYVPTAHNETNPDATTHTTQQAHEY